ncbi:WxL domain-containing protein [Enterococcus saccharolyticus]|uniref:WxL domain-containing protein n=1 Tax=Enterococcus TaxID=1350 RepID=UPI001E408562|nr:WxL domain-containing protein [Enterococcus saccharolyticus]MCD5003502.1 WxL domain-containing protein [Enterococcus saccharolyticus]
MRKELIRFLILNSIILSVLSIEANAEEIKSYQSNGVVEFVPNLDSTDPVNPENPDPEKPVKPIDPTDSDGPNPGTQGPLSIDYASSLDFGKNRISNKDQVYFARAQSYQGDQEDTPNFVQVSDNRGTNSGWTLSVTQEAQLTSTTPTLNNVLTGAKMTLSNSAISSNVQHITAPEAKNSIELVPGLASIVTFAKADTGAGTWATYWGHVEKVEEVDENGDTRQVNVTKAIQLAVPGSTPKDAVKYQTKLVWTLTDIPEI